MSYLPSLTNGIQALQDRDVWIARGPILKNKLHFVTFQASILVCLELFNRLLCIYIYIYMCVCVCVQTDRLIERERKKERANLERRRQRLCHTL